VAADLQGKSILITRASAQSGELARLLSESGALVLEWLGIELEPVQDFTAIDDAISSLPSYQWLLFTSANAVDYFMRRVTQKGVSIPSIDIAVVGSTTAQKLRQWNLSTDLMPDQFNAEGLLEAFPRDLSGKRILFPRAEVAREILPEVLRRRGAIVDVVPVYRAKMADGAIDIAKILQGAAVDCIVFTSSGAVHVVAESLGDQLQLRFNNILVAVIGPVTARACEEHGLKVSIQPSTATIPNLVAAIRDYFSNRNRH